MVRCRNILNKKSVILPITTVPFQSIRQSRVTGLPKSTKCHDCHGHFGEVTKSFGDHVPNIKKFRRLRRQTAENFVHVTAKLGGCRNHIFVMCVTRHGAWRIDWNGTVVAAFWGLPSPPCRTSQLEALAVSPRVLNVDSPQNDRSFSSWQCNLLNTIYCNLGSGQSDLTPSPSHYPFDTGNLSAGKPLRHLWLSPKTWTWIFVSLYA
jgi:hypothetical protein